MLYRKIDPETGLFIEDVILIETPYKTQKVTVYREEVIDGVPVEVPYEIDEIVLDEFGSPVPADEYIAVPVPQGFYLPKWSGTEWVEGLTQEEIEVIKSVTQPLTPDEKIAELAETIDVILTEVIPSLMV